MQLRQITEYIRTHGLLYTLQRTGEKASERVLHRYHRLWQRWQTSPAELEQQRQHQPDAGLISVAIPVYNTQPDMLLALAASLAAQTYANWEAVLYDGASTHADTIEALKKAAAMDSRIRVIFGTENTGISGNTNAAIAQARGWYIALCDHDDLLTPDALWRVAEAIVRTQADMLYSDEDKVTEDGRWHTDPHLKPDFGPDTLRSGNYICHLMILKASLLNQVGGLRPAYDGSQDHDLALRCSELAQHVEHIPHILYHWRTVGASMSHQRLQVCMDAACRAVADQMRRLHAPGEAWIEHGVIRLRYDVPAHLTVRVLLLHASNQPAAPLPKAFTRLGVTVQRVCAANPEDVNASVLAASEDLLLLMDEHAVMPLNDDFLTELMMYAQRDDVGAVCPVLLKPGKPAIIAAAGMAVMDDGRVCPRHAGMPYIGGGLRAQALTSHNISVVIPHCFMIRRDHWQPIEAPYDQMCIPHWCIKLAACGLRHVYTPHARASFTHQHSLYHTLPTARLPADFRDPCISPYYTSGEAADFKLTQRSHPHAVD